MFILCNKCQQKCVHNNWKFGCPLLQGNIRVTSNRTKKSKLFKYFKIQVLYLKNKAAAQIAGADPSHDIFTTKKNVAGPIKLPQIFNQWSKLKILQDLEWPEPVQHSLLYDCKPLLLPLRRQGFVKSAEEKGD